MSEVRPILPEEIRLLPEIEKSADLLFEEAGFTDLPPPAGPKEYKDAKFILVANDPPKGFVRVDEIDGLVHIEQLSVARPHMEKGLGSALLEGACTLVKQQGYDSITLITFSGIRWNEDFYKKHGFAELAELTLGLMKLRKHEIELGLDDVAKRIVMKRDL
ncbi:MAG: GNAT family N-acetyltransferase [Patescibacteria group bacterium]